MIEDKLREIVRKKSTLLGVGPMSKNIVDASIELGSDYSIPILLIASRRQIDSSEFNGGYVNNWTTQEWSEYVKKKDFKNNIILCRDHGGPWQNNIEKLNNLDLSQAMESAKISYENDIKSGLQIIHIDPSIDIHNNTNIDTILDRIKELYEFCVEKAEKYKKDIIFEIGTEEQSGGTNTLEELEYTLNNIYSFCYENKFKNPSFVVIQCGTKVMEMRNVGSFESPFRIKNEIPIEIQLPKMIEICNKYNIFMKEHNTDYLTTEALTWHPRLGIHAANVAPEFGLAETKTLISILEANNLKKIRDEFIELAYNSKKWDKWMLSDSKASDKDRALIAGHYVFSNEIFKELKLKAEVELNKLGINLDEKLIYSIKNCIKRYLKAFRLIKT
tara:strand:+ start:469 stop:1632 length:1164 start_codon:yes stop_codon:yes gene_type:complete